MESKILKKHHKKLTVVAFLLFIFIGLTVATFFLEKKNSLNESKLRIMAEKILLDCKDEPFTPDCYDREIPKLMSKISMEQAFEVTRIVQESDEKYLFCHVLAHKLSYIETNKNKSSWKDVITRCPVTMCNNGCPHGALMSRFTGESLTPSEIEEVVPELMNVCEPRKGWNPTEVERSMCYHAFGHLNMFITGANIKESLSLCRRVGTKDDGRDYYQTCIQGVFMTLYQALEPEDIALVKDITPKKDNVVDFCKQFDQEKDNFFVCVIESWPFFINEIKNPEGLDKFCSFTNDKWGKNWCYGTSFAILTTDFVENDSLDKAVKYCTSVDIDYRELCFANMAARLVQIDPKYARKAVDLCTLAEKNGFGKNCFSDLLFYSGYSFVRGSKEHESYCLLFEGQRRSDCLSGNIPKDFYVNL